MRKIILAMLVAFTALIGAQARAMEGFDLGDMPPLPPPLLENDAPGTAASAPSLTPPPSGAASPLVESQTTSSAGLTPVAPPPADAFLAPPPPPPLAPPALAPPAATATNTAGALLPPAAPAVPPADAAAVPVVLDETPQPGRITGGRVNVRAGPNTQYESVAVLTSGVPVTVMARHGDWYKIVFPADQLASIHKSLVTAEITGEIPETGLPGIVNAANAEVHAFYWDKSTVVGILNQGDPVVIKQERGQWYRIDAPATARAFVSAQYVRLEGAGQVVADAAPAPVNPAVDLTAGADPQTGQIRLSENDRKVAELKEQYFKRIQQQYDAQIDAEEAAYQAAVEENKRQAQQLDLALQDLDGRLAAIDQETAQRMNQVYQAYQPTLLTTVGAAEWAPLDPATGGYTGWVENIGRVGEAPSAHRLTKGGEIRFHLRSGAYNLDEFNGRRVWVNGPVEPASGASAAMLNVEQIRVLTELEIAEGMRQNPYAQQQPYGAVQLYADPYAQPQQAQPYGVTPQPYYDANMGALQPGETMIDPATGLPVGAQTVTAPGMYIGPAAPNPVPTTGGTGGMAPSDPSQLPDVVGSGSTVYPTDATPAFGMDGGLNSGLGEVESDSYEQPVISEIGPE